MKTLLLNHIRLWISLLVGLAVFVLAPREWSAVTRVLTGWNCGVFLFLALIFRWMPRLTADEICDQFVEEDETAPFLLVGCVVAALLSQVAIVALLSTLNDTSGIERAAHVVLAALTVISSWTLVPTMFTVHYADMFYSVSKNQRPLEFPHTPLPVFWDFAYFSFTIAAACQTSDVSTTNDSVRKVVIAQSVISFLFNAAILGFAINVTAGLISGN
jgi:uncharacterized membrane protein